MGSVADRVHWISHWPKVQCKKLKKKEIKKKKIKENENDVAQKKEKNELET